MSEHNLLTLNNSDSLELVSGDYLSCEGALSNSGTAFGDGTIGIDWSEPIQGDSASVTCTIAEENIPTASITPEVKSRTLIVDCEDIGASSYLLSLDGGTAVDVTDDLNHRYVGLEPSSSHTIALTATNSRGSSVSGSWNITLGAFFTVYEVAQEMYSQPKLTHGANAVFMARILDKETGTALAETDVESITLNAWKYHRNANGDSREAVSGFSDVDVPTDTVLTAVTDSDFWNLDDEGINFIHVPDQRASWLFPTPGAYLVEYSFTLVSGNPINLHYEINVF